MLQLRNGCACGERYGEHLLELRNDLPVGIVALPAVRMRDDQYKLN